MLNNQNAIRELVSPVKWDNHNRDKVGYNIFVVVICLINCTFCRKSKEVEEKIFSINKHVETLMSDEWRVKQTF